MSRPPVNARVAADWERFQQLNEAGLRTEASQALARFCSALTPTDQAAFTRWFCRRRYGGSQHRQMRSHLMPLTRDVLLAVLLSAAGCGDPENLRWLVHVRYDPAMRTDVLVPGLHERSRFAGLLAVALARNPDAPRLWPLAFYYELHPAEWGMHHLGEGILISSEYECRASLARARAVAAAAPEGALDSSDRDEVAALDAALDDYREWKSSASSLTFPSWCSERGRVYSWPVPYYYGPG